MKKATFLIFVFIGFFFLLVQNTTAKEKTIEIVFSIPEKLSLGSFFKLNDKDSIKIEKLKFYVSNFEFVNQENKHFTPTNSYYLIDFEKKESLVINLKIDENFNFNLIKFNLGIDSTTNVSGAYGGDLDPSNGMYWTWQSGYINFKLEGISNLCKNEKNEFQFHLGGYQFPNNSLTEVQLKTKNSTPITLSLDLFKLFSQFSSSSFNNIMSPSKQAVDLSKSISKLFFISEK